MAPAKTMTGARGQLIVADPTTGEAKVVGIFNNVSWGLAYSVESIYLIGRYSADELVYTSQETVSVRAGGFRVVNAGPHKAAKVPKLADLMRHEYMELALYDRLTQQPIAKIHSIRPTGYDTSVGARGVEEITVTFVGLLVDDENTTNAELPDASRLP